MSVIKGILDGNGKFKSSAVPVFKAEVCHDVTAEAVGGQAVNVIHNRIQLDFGGNVQIGTQGDLVVGGLPFCHL